jgi:hypothetical protein
VWVTNPVGTIMYHLDDNVPFTSKAFSKNQLWPKNSTSEIFHLQESYGHFTVCFYTFPTFMTLNHKKTGDVLIT